MFLTEYDEEKTLQQTKQEGIDEERERFATVMLKDGKPLSEITKYSMLSEAAVRNIATQRGFVIA